MATLYALQSCDRTTPSADQSNFPDLPPQPQLRDVNRCLQFLELPPLTACTMQTLLSQQPRDRVLNAIRRAGRGDAGSLAFLRHRLTAVCQSPAAPQQLLPRLSATATARTPPAEQGEIDATAAKRAAPTAAAESTARPDADPKVISTRWESVHVYGQAGALCFEADQTRRGCHTVALEAALATAPRQYGWDKKIRLQLTRAELPQVLAVLLGLLPRCEFKNHGEGNYKGFSVEHQVDRVCVRVFAKGQALRTVPIGLPEAYRVAALFLRQLQQNEPWLQGGEILMLVKLTVGRLRPSPAPSLSGDTPRDGSGFVPRQSVSP
ncbi:MAG: hypothetical protein U1F76_21010 [Candidatus Competibacteraceae bacterium]